MEHARKELDKAQKVRSFEGAYFNYLVSKTLNKSRGKVYLVDQEKEVIQNLPEYLQLVYRKVK